MATTSTSTSKNGSKSFISLNDCTLTGRISKVVTNESRSYVRFSVAHNMGKNNDPLFVELVMFGKNGNKTVEIPFDILKVGAAVKVSAFLRPNNMKDEDGRITRYDNQFVVKSVELIGGESEETPEEAPAEQAAAPQAEPEAPAAKPRKARKSSRKTDE